MWIETGMPSSHAAAQNGSSACETDVPPDGQFEMLRAADPVYRFLGVEGLSVKKAPAQGVLVDSRLGYWVRAGKHSMNREDWRVFVDFADKHLR